MLLTQKDLDPTLSETRESAGHADRSCISKQPDSTRRALSALWLGSKKSLIWDWHPEPDAVRNPEKRRAC